MGLVSGEAASLAPSAEHRRRQVVAITSVVYLLLIGEGVLRKWLFPGFSQALFFVRDPVVLAAYLLALEGGLWPKGRALLVAGIGLGLAALGLAVVQFVLSPASGASPLLFEAYGWRNYFFYIPLAFLIGSTFQRRDIDRLLRTTLWLAIPIAALVVAQFYAPQDSVINVGFGDDPAQQFHGLGLNEDHVRPMGPFTSDVGQKEFAVSCVAMLLALWIAPASRRAAPFLLLAASSVATLTCIAFSGSRGALLHAGTVIACAVLIALLQARRSGSRRALIVLSGLAGAACLVVPIVFADGYQTFLERWDSAFAFESQTFTGGILGRALFGFIDFTRLLGDTPMIGYGLGLGGNASTLLGATVGGEVPVTVAETDWARHVVDLGPVLGVLFIAYRVALVAWVGSVAWRGMRGGMDPLPMLLFAFVALELLFGQITGHGTVNGYGWIFTGLCLAAANSAPATSESLAAVQPSPRAERFPNLLR